MVTRRAILIGIAVAWAALAAACAAATERPPPAQGNALPGTQWVLVSLKGAPPIEGTEVALRFGEASIEGSGGCNRYGGSYTASEERLTLSDLYWTEMACMEPKGNMEQEQVYLQALGAVARYRVAGDRLELYDQGGAQILAFVASTSTSLAGEETPVRTTPGRSLGCALTLDETYPVGAPVNLHFELHNPTDRTVYVLAWYTPLEGMAGDMFRMTHNGQELPYLGILAKRGDPLPEEYIALKPGGGTSADLELGMGYDLSTPGSYQVAFTAGLQDVVEEGSLVPQKQGAHRRQSLSCNTVRFRIVPAPGPPTATLVAPPTPTGGLPTPTPLAPPATPAGREPPPGVTQVVVAASGVSPWVPES